MLSSRPGLKSKTASQKTKLEGKGTLVICNLSFHFFSNKQVDFQVFKDNLNFSLCVLSIFLLAHWYELLVLSMH